MHELDRIEGALATSSLDHELFERCAQDLLLKSIPGCPQCPEGGTGGVTPTSAVLVSRHPASWRQHPEISTECGLTSRVALTVWRIMASGSTG